MAEKLLPGGCGQPTITGFNKVGRNGAVGLFLKGLISSLQKGKPSCLMKADAIQKVVAARLNKARAHFKKLPESFDPEVLHDFRLEMKKLKAFLRLLNTARPHHNNISLSKELKTVYRLAGSLRNLQLHEQRVAALVKENNLKPPVCYLAGLDQEKRKAVQQLQAAAGTVSFSRFRKDVVLQLPAALRAEDCQQYLARQLRTLTGMLVPPSFNEEALHEVRKVIKDIGYNRNYVGTYLSLLLPLGLVKKEQADALAEKLGVFHDLCLSHYLLQSPVAVPFREPEERGTLQELFQIIETQKKRMKIEVTQQLLSM